MTDITMCSGVGCDMKHDCYRFTANRGMWQYYFSKPPIKDGKCEMFWDNKLTAAKPISRQVIDNEDSKDLLK
jgi:hypothetical protein